MSPRHHTQESVDVYVISQRPPTQELMCICKFSQNPHTRTYGYSWHLPETPHTRTYLYLLGLPDPTHKNLLVFMSSLRPHTHKNLWIFVMSPRNSTHNILWVFIMCLRRCTHKCMGMVGKKGDEIRGKFWNLEEICAFLDIKYAWNWEIVPACQEKNIFFSPAYVFVWGLPYAGLERVIFLRGRGHLSWIFSRREMLFPGRKFPFWLTQNKWFLKMKSKKKKKKRSAPRFVTFPHIFNFPPSLFHFPFFFPIFPFFLASLFLPLFSR